MARLEKTTEAIIISGWVLLMSACYGIIGVAIWFASDAIRADLAKTALGFVMGSLPLMLKDLLLQKTTTPPVTPPKA